ncbi:L-type lectin-domain containing receptor kinase IV.1-like [Rhododendron vialii]|uniref:L-type lectin-domain containing receptor kinase IV.1-like n=1 Tax=Rhododendron vialii TaxID=182163 RepID=UPI00265EDBC2|nr:L-type lectin-domain containing receptor kinase IV.1-like [Rhododendron vialii]XP_058201008.1 L-type lectin-domain containing receptor kinase IV.1-like [Rhododendron vialii]
MFLTPLFSLSPLLLLLLLLALLPTTPAQDHLGFTFNNFKASPNLALDGIAEFKPSGLLALTNGTRQRMGHAFFPTSFPFKPSPNATTSSFSTSFIFSTIPEYPTLSGHGIVFVVAPSPRLPGALPSQWLGLFNATNNGNSTNHVFAVELDTIYSSEFEDLNDNHVGIDINGLNSVESQAAGYYSSNGRFQNLSLISGKAMQVWVEYDGGKKEINVTMAPVHSPKPNTPLLTLSKDLSPFLNQNMYVGFSSSTGSDTTSHYILAWSFQINGFADGFDFSQLPKLPRIGPKKVSRLLTIGLPLSLVLVFGVLSGVVYYVRRKRKFAEVLEDWELDYGPHRFKYKDLYIATKGFTEKGLLGSGGFGRVYRGILPTSKIEVAVKRLSHESGQGMKEFVAEIVSIGRLRHRNLVQLLGYCRRRGELLLVYDYMPNGSLDKFLYDQPSCTLNWRQRFRVIKGVASGLFYLHEEWEQVVVHRDVKASNVLLDGELNGRLGDFGLARLSDHGTNPQSTNVAGTLGYLAPEHNRTGKATTSTDVYAFGAFLLEVVCGRRPIEPRAAAEDLVLVDWVFSFWRKGEVLRTIDPKLGSEYVVEEVELVLKLGLMCSHSEPAARPNMRQVVEYLEGDIPLPELKLMRISATGLTFAQCEGFDDFAQSSSMENAFSHASSVTGSVLSGGR